MQHLPIIRDFKRIVLETDSPLAGDSPDHLNPKGTRFDLSVNARFNYKIHLLFRERIPQIKVLDLGCSSGVFVKSWIESGHFAIGVEGSNYSQIFQRGAWPIISKFLFTADLTNPFSLKIETTAETYPLKFDLVTAWEVMEHIPETGLGTVVENIKKHLSDNGYFICSISPREAIGIHDTDELHQTVQSLDWWESYFEKQGLKRNRELENFFNGQYVRGGIIDAYESFNFVLHHANATTHFVPKIKFTQRLMDKWINSRLQRFCKIFLGL
jgi:SAM-dependent methyltransferase